MTQQFSTLDNAFALTPYPRGNLEFIRAYTGAIGITGYTVLSSYIRADRADGGPPLQIASGWCAGFRDESEAREACGQDVAVWESEDRAGIWGVDHPIHGRGWRTRWRAARSPSRSSAPCASSSCPPPGSAHTVHELPYGMSGWPGSERPHMLLSCTEWEVS